MVNDKSVEYSEKLIHINRVSKTIKGGRTLSFSALVIVGNKKGRIGFGHGKAKDVTDAIKKAGQNAKKNTIYVNLKDAKTIYHDLNGKWGAAKVILKSAKSGTGIIAGGSIRPIFELLGITDIVAKSLGSSNPYNLLRACFEALKIQQTPKYISLKLNS
jgi:small subunit ribosomal protein S5